MPSTKPKCNDAEYRKELYRRHRHNLIIYLGGMCVDCLETDEDKLEFDHLRQRTWVCRQLNRLHRIYRYRKEAEAGLLLLRCRSCNARKGQPALPDVDDSF